MKVLVTGVKGQLGGDVVACLEAQNVPCWGVDIDDFDLTDEKAVRQAVLGYAPDVIVHCAAYTAVDKAEDEGREVCRKVNVEGTRNMAQCAKELDAKFMYFSTDYVFPGTGTTPYVEEDATGPSNFYGLTKLKGEQAVKELLTKYFTLRISWVFADHGHNFIRTMLRLSETHDTLTVVNDQIGSPTYCPDVAKLVCEMIRTEQYGTYHVTNEGLCSWYDFAVEIFRQAGKKVTVKPVTSEEYGASKAVRPKNSRMSKDKLEQAGFHRLPAWQDALTRFLKNVGEYHPVEL